MTQTPSSESAALLCFIDDVRRGLGTDGPRSLPSKYLYDEVGSALFEVICVLPEYGLTRADRRLLLRHTRDWIAALPPRCAVAELGSGSSKKTRIILEALVQRGPTTYMPIDISAAALQGCARELGDIRGLDIHGLHAEYLPGLQAASARRHDEGPLLVLFLGSTIGNFDRQAGEDFLASVRQQLRPGDLLFLSADMVKSEPQLVAAYDDSIGVTAAFNKNVLARINRELAGQFSLQDFAHVARWNPKERRIEMHLQALRDLTVRIERADLDVAMRRGETIKTEDSYKFSYDDLLAMTQRAGFHISGHWHDDEWSFSQSLLLAS